MAVLVVVDMGYAEPEFTCLQIAAGVRLILDGAGSMYEHVIFTVPDGDEFHRAIAGWILHHVLTPTISNFLQIIDKKDLAEALNKLPAQEIHFCGTAYSTFTRGFIEDMIEKQSPHRFVVFAAGATMASYKQAKKAANNNLKYKGAIVL